VARPIRGEGGGELFLKLEKKQINKNVATKLKGGRVRPYATLAPAYYF